MKLTRTEQFVYDWQYDLHGDCFAGNLAKLIAKGDLHNQAKLARGFPDEVEAIQRFQTEAGYWERILDKAHQGNLLDFGEAKSQRYVAQKVVRKPQQPSVNYQGGL